MHREITNITTQPASLLSEASIELEPREAAEEAYQPLMGLSVSPDAERIQSRTDLEERLAAEEERRHRAEEAYRVLVQYSIQGLAILQSNRIVFANNAMAELTGYRVEEMMAMSSRVVRIIVHPDDQQLVAARLLNLQTGIQASPHLEIRFIHKDGSVRWAEAFGSRVEYRGLPSVQVACVDITSRKEVEAALKYGEELFRSLSKNASDIITILEEDGTITYKSSSVKRLLGYEPDELIWKDMFGLMHSDDRDKVRRLLAEVVAVPDSTRSVEFRIRHKAGSWRVLESIFRNLFDDPIIAGVVVNSRDITRRRQTENEKAQLLEKIQQQHEQLRTLAGRRRKLAQQLVLAQEQERHRVSRELHDEAGQALTGLKVSLEMVLAELTTPSLTALDVAPVRQRLEKALALCSTTMAHIRLLAHGLHPAALEDLGLNLTLEGFCRDFFDHTQLRIEYIGQELPLLPAAVEICLYRFLQEALTNVAKHAQATHVYVRLRYENEAIRLSVQDNGRGFNSRAEIGAYHYIRGLGLLGMEERLEALGGQLELESRPGWGTRLVAIVPQQDVE